MTTDLWMLVASVALQWALIMTVATPGILKKGLPWALSNRNEAYELSGWEVRAQRASNNLAENLILFAALVLVAHVAGKASATTALGAELFFGARVAHAVVYIAGVPVLRTLTWAVSIVGLVLIALALC